MRLTLKLIRSYIPKEYYDGTKLKGISLTKNSYNLFYSYYDKNIYFRTSIDNPLIGILRDKFDIIYIRPFYFHYHEYIIKSKS